MAFPEDPLGLRVEINTGEWVDITGDVYSRDPITHTRGRGANSAVTDPASMPLTINNKDGKYSPRNPSSPYFGKIGRNTPVRMWLPGGTPYLDLDGTPYQAASTPDAPVLDLTGDLDVRMDLDADWYNPVNQMIIGKWEAATGDQRSWVVRLVGGVVQLIVSNDGVANRSFGGELPRTLHGRTCLRLTLDADNGTGHPAVGFYQADTMAGPWTEFQPTFVSTGAPAVIYNSTAPLSVAPTSISDTNYNIPVSAKVYACEVRSSINGTIVANPDFSAQTPGTASFTDGAGRTWSFTDTAIADRQERFVGEIASWPQRWVPSGADMWTPVEAAGILRRLGQGKKALDSALRRRIPSFSPLAYWPMEDGAQATQAASPIPGVSPLTVTGFDFAQANSLPSSGPLGTLNSKKGQGLPRLRGTIPSAGANLSAWSVNFVYRLDQPPNDLRTVLRILSNGTVGQWLIQQAEDAVGSRIVGKDADGNTLISQNVNTGGDLWGQWTRIQFQVSQSGTNLHWKIVWTDVGGDSGIFEGDYPGTCGRPTGVAAPEDGYSPLLDGMAIGHISAWPTTTTTAYDRAIDAWIGEQAGQRMLRLSVEEGVPLVMLTSSWDTELVGTQRPVALLDLLSECAEADGGILGEELGRTALSYRPRVTLYNQEPKLTLEYGARGEIAPPLEPVDDDDATRNDVTVQRTDGASARVTLDEGPLSTQTPPLGVGIYDEQVTLNLASDDQTLQQAAWRLHLGTVDEARYPTVRVLLHRAPHLIPDVLTIREGDIIRLTNLPAWLAGGDVDLMVTGYSETLLPRTWEITFTCVPGSPWQVGVVGDEVFGRADTDGCTTTSARTTTQTFLPVTSSGPTWTRSSDDLPFDIVVGGEVMTVTAVGAPSGGAQTLTVIRSVNGVVKAHASGTDVRLATPTIVAF